MNKGKKISPEAHEKTILYLGSSIALREGEFPSLAGIVNKFPFVSFENSSLTSVCKS